MKPWTLPILSIALPTVVGLACSSETTNGGVDSADASSPDSGITNADAAADTGTRGLVEWRPLGELPVDNLVLSPTLDPLVSIGPQPFAPDAQLDRFIFRDSPAKTPSVSVPIDDGMFLLTQTHGNRLRAEIWIGWPDTQPNEGVFVSIIGVNEAGEEIQALLTPLTEASLVIDGIRWIRFAGTIEQRLYGLGVLIVQNISTDVVWANGPVVVPVVSNFLNDGEPRAWAPSIQTTRVSESWAPLVRYVHEWAERHAKDNLQRPLQSPQRRPIRRR